MIHIPRRKCVQIMGRYAENMCVSANHILSYCGNDCDVLPQELLVFSNFASNFSQAIRYNSISVGNLCRLIVYATTYEYAYICIHMSYVRDQFILFYLIFSFFQYLLSPARALVCEWSELCVIYSRGYDSIDPIPKPRNTLFYWGLKCCQLW